MILFTSYDSKLVGGMVCKINKFSKRIYVIYVAFDVNFTL